MPEYSKQQTKVIQKNTIKNIIINKASKNHIDIFFHLQGNH